MTWAVTGACAALLSVLFLDETKFGMGLVPLSNACGRGHSGCGCGSIFRRVRNLVSVLTQINTPN